MDADTEAKKLYTLPEVKNYVLEKISPQAYRESFVDYKLIASVIFGDDEKYEALIGFLKPLLKNILAELLSLYSEKYIVLEAAMLFEYGLESVCDDVVCVVADKDTRAERVMLRDNCSRETFESRERYQWPQENKIRLSDFIIKNNDNDAIIPQVEKLRLKYK